MEDGRTAIANVAPHRRGKYWTNGTWRSFNQRSYSSGMDEDTQRE